MTSPDPLPPAAADELARRLGDVRPPPVRGRWVGATSTVLRWGDDLCVKVPHADPEAVTACLRHARLAPVVRRFGKADPVWRSVGEQFAVLHAVPRSAVGLELSSFAQHPAVDPARLAEEALRDGRLDASLARRVRALRDRLVGEVLPDDRRVLCHGDLHAQNVVVRAGRYVGLLDLAGAGWLDAAWDFTVVPAAAVAPCLVGYADAGGAEGAMLPRIAWCRLQSALHRRASVEELLRVLGEVERLAGQAGR